MAQICPNCKAANDDTVTFCLRCGTRLNQPTDTIVADFGTQAEQKKSNLLIPILVGLGALVCLAAIIAGAVYLFQDRSAADVTPVVPTEAVVLSTETPAPPPAATDTPQAPTEEPLPAETALPTFTPKPAQPTPNQYGLAVGIQVRVFTTEGDTLRMRDAPGAQGQVIAQLAKGTLLTIIDGPETGAAPA